MNIAVLFISIKYPLIIYLFETLWEILIHLFYFFFACIRTKLPTDRLTDYKLELETKSVYYVFQTKTSTTAAQPVLSISQKLIGKLSFYRNLTAADA